VLSANRCSATGDGAGRSRRSITRGEAGQSLVVMLGPLAALVLGALVLAAFGQALGDRGRHQKAADLAAISATQEMRHLYAPPGRARLPGCSLVEPRGQTGR
jgi:hypothetical protein